jgi:hypothetical protein
MRFLDPGFRRLNAGNPLKEVRALRQCTINRRVDGLVDGARNC